MTQQTIGNTVYRVGQELKNYTEAGLLIDYLWEHDANFRFYGLKKTKGAMYSVTDIQIEDFPITITALPDPDSVAVKPTPLTREELLTEDIDCVWLRSPSGNYLSVDELGCISGLYALGIPMFRTEADVGAWEKKLRQEVMLAVHPLQPEYEKLQQQLATVTAERDALRDKQVKLKNLPVRPSLWNYGTEDWRI